MKIDLRNLIFYSSPFLGLIAISLLAYVVVANLPFGMPFTTFIAFSSLFTIIVYYTLVDFEDVKKELEKGEKHGKPKPKCRWRKASARPR